MSSGPVVPMNDIPMGNPVGCEQFVFLPTALYAGRLPGGQGCQVNESL